MDTKKNIDHKIELQLYRKTNDQAIIARLYTEYISRIYGLSLKYLKNEEDSKDAVMSIYELIQEKLKKQEIENFNSWIYIVSRNYVFEQLRKRGKVKHKEKEANRVYYESLLHPDNIEDEQLLEKLKYCLENLSDMQGKCITLFYFKNQSYESISQTLKLKWDSVRSNIQNGRRNLKKCMEAK